MGDARFVDAFGVGRLRFQLPVSQSSTIEVDIIQRGVVAPHIQDIISEVLFNGPMPRLTVRERSYVVSDSLLLTYNPFNLTNYYERRSNHRCHVLGYGSTRLDQSYCIQRQFYLFLNGTAVLLPVLITRLLLNPPFGGQRSLKQRNKVSLALELSQISIAHHFQSQAKQSPFSRCSL